ncbi:proline transporter 1-like [Vitis riparia]|uniref:proline transporter 1-like n=1 Tax=Vitis riparia TaxID=96939 RepID=UPI00155ACAFB|nr:proline transporter 1-like [Vitis riparia]
MRVNRMFAAPIHEALDTKFLRPDKSLLYSRENLKRRFLLRALLFAGSTLVTAAFPFMSDFVDLFGSFTLTTLTFVFPSMIFIKVEGKTARIEKKVWHWANIVVFSLLGVATTVSALRLIVNNVQNYHFFADT